MTRRWKFVLCLGSLLASPMAAFSQNPSQTSLSFYIYPEICHSQAKSQEILKFVDDPQDYDHVLSKDYVYGRTFDLPKIQKNYEESFLWFVDQLDISNPSKGLSKTAKYIYECLQNEQSCHNFFAHESGKYLEHHCNFQFYKTAIEDSFESAHRKALMCGELSELYFDYPVEEDPRYQKLCFDQDQKHINVNADEDENDGKTFKTLTYLDNIKHNFYKLQSKLIQKHVDYDREIFIFALYKLHEDFDFAYSNHELDRINQYYNMMYLVDELAKCGDAQFATPRYQLIGQHILSDAKDIYRDHQNEHGQLGRFSIHLTELSDLGYFQLLMERYFQDRIQNRSYEDWTLAEEIQYFKLLEWKQTIKTQPTDTLGVQEFSKIKDFVDKLAKGEADTFETLVQSKTDVVGQNNVSNFYSHAETFDVLCNTTQSCHGDGTGKGFVLKRKYDDLIHGQDIENIRDQFIQDESFRKYLLGHLTELENKAIQKQFEATKTKYHHKIHHGHLPYQFYDLILNDFQMHLQKFHVEYVIEHYLSDETFFEKQVYSRYCENKRPEYKDYELRKKFCHTLQDDDHKKNELKRIFSMKVKESYDYLQRMAYTGQLSFYDYEYKDFEDPQQRSHVMGENDVLFINSQIKKINNFCYNHMVPSGTQQFNNADIQTLHEHMHSFATNPTVNQMLGYSHFTDVIELVPHRILDASCFERGFVFGGGLDHTSWGQVGRLVGHYDDNRQSWYQPSDFSISLHDLHQVENDINSDFQKEFENLYFGYLHNDQRQYEDYLKESVLARTGALIDYARDHPSLRVGQHICELVKQADHKEMKRMEIISTINTCAMIASFALLPSNKIGLKQLIYYGSYYLLGGVWLGTHQYAIEKEKDSRTLTNIGFLAKHLSAEEALFIHTDIQAMIDNQRLARNFSVLFFIPTYSSIENFIARNATYFKKATREIYVRRKLYVEKFLTQETKRETQQILQNSKLLKDNLARTFLFNAKNVSPKQFDEIMLRYHLGNGDDYFRETFGRKLQSLYGTSKYMPAAMEKVKPKTVEPLTARAINWASNKITPNESSSSLYTMLFNRAIWVKDHVKWVGLGTLRYVDYGFLNFLSIKQWVWQRAIAGPYHGVRKLLASPGNKAKWEYVYQVPYDIEVRMVTLFNKAKSYTDETGRVVFPESMRRKFIEQLKYHKEVSGGKIIANIDIQRTSMLKQIMKNIHVKNERLRSQIHSYLEPMIHGELMTADELLTWSKNFNGRIENLSDCKLVLKGLKFANREYHRFRDQFIFRGKGLLNPRAYAERREYILKNFDVFYDIGRYLNRKTQRRFYDRIQALKQESGDVLDMEKVNRIIREVQNEFPIKFSQNTQSRSLTKQFHESEEFSLKYIENNLSRIDKEIADFEMNRFEQIFGTPYSDDLYFSLSSRSSWVRAGKLNWRKTKRAVHSKPDHYLENEFLELELVNNGHFYRHFESALKKNKNDIKAAYAHAYRKAKVRKAIEYECSSPRSEVRLYSNSVIKRWTKRISIATYSSGYMMNHWDEPKDQEFFTRMGFDVAIPFIASILRVNVFTKKGQTPVWKIYNDWEKMAGATALFDAGGLILLDNLFWSHDAVFPSHRTKNEFIERIKQTDDVKKLFDEVLTEGGEHQEIAELVFEKYNEIATRINALYERQANGEFKSEKDLVDEAIKLGLIDELFDKSDSPYLSEEEIEAHDQLEEELLDQFAEMIYQEKRARKKEYANWYGIKLDSDDLQNIPPFTAGYIAEYGDQYNIMRSQEWEFLDPFEMSDSFHDALNRYMFYRVWDGGFYSWIIYARTHLMYKALCQWRLRPVGSPMGAIAVYAAFKAVLDPITFYVRKKTTGY